MTSERQDRGVDVGHMVIGFVVLVIGVGFLIGQMGIVHVRVSSRLWPLILVVMGLARVVWPRARDGQKPTRRGGIWLLSIGIWGLISEFRLFGLHYGTSWPLLIIAAGINMVWRAFEEPQTPRPVREN